MPVRRLEALGQLRPFAHLRPREVRPLADHPPLKRLVRLQHPRLAAGDAPLLQVRRRAQHFVCGDRLDAVRLLERAHPPAPDARHADQQRDARRYRRPKPRPRPATVHGEHGLAHRRRHVHRAGVVPDISGRKLRQRQQVRHRRPRLHPHRRMPRDRLGRPKHLSHRPQDIAGRRLLLRQTDEQEPPPVPLRPLAQHAPPALGVPGLDRDVRRPADTGDRVAARIESEALEDGAAGIEVRFARGQLGVD